MSESFEMRKAQLATAITRIGAIIDIYDGHISGHAIGLLNEARTEVQAELQLLQEHDCA